MFSTLLYSLHGIHIRIESEYKSVIEAASFDFGVDVNHEAHNKPDLSVTVTSAQPAGYEFGDEKGRINSGVKFKILRGQKSNAEELIEYNNGIFCIWDSSAEHAHFWGDNQDGIYEKLYLFLLSRLGDKLEKNGFFRIHGFGVHYKNRTILGMAPSGGGKSTLGWELLKNNACKLISDDAPLLSLQHDKVELIPFKIRLGFTKDTSFHTIPENELRVFKRTARSDKVLISPLSSIIEWSDSNNPLSDIVSLQFTKEANSRIEPLSQFGLIKLLFRDLVIGYGLPQVVEFFLKNGVRSIFSRIPLIIKRIWIGFHICKQTKAVVFYQNNNTAGNAKLLLDYLDKTQ